MKYASNAESDAPNPSPCKAFLTLQLVLGSQRSGADLRNLRLRPVSRFAMSSSYSFVCCGYTKDGSGQRSFAPPPPLDQGHYGFQGYYPPDLYQPPPYRLQANGRPLALLPPSNNNRPPVAPMAPYSSSPSSRFHVHPGPSTYPVMVVPPVTTPGPVVIRGPRSPRSDWSPISSPTTSARIHKAIVNPRLHRRSSSSSDSESDSSYAAPSPHQYQEPPRSSYIPPSVAVPGPKASDSTPQPDVTQATSRRVSSPISQPVPHSDSNSYVRQQQPHSLTNPVAGIEEGTLILFENQLQPQRPSLNRGSEINSSPPPRTSSRSLESS